MNQKKKDNSKDPWYVQVDDEIKSVGNKCKYSGENKFYIPEDPFQYKSLDGYLKASKLKSMNPQSWLSKNCQLDKSNKMQQTDPHHRYYKNVYSQNMCDAMQKVNKDASWDPNAINRHNKYGRGTCWTNAENNKCGRNTDNKYVLSKEVVSPEDREAAYQSSLQKCRANEDKCHWDDAMNDCVAGARVQTPPRIPTPPFKEPKRRQQTPTTPPPKYYTPEEPSPSPKYYTPMDSTPRPTPLKMPTPTPTPKQPTPTPTPKQPTPTPTPKMPTPTPKMPTPTPTPTPKQPTPTPKQPTPTPPRVPTPTPPRYDPASDIPLDINNPTSKIYGFIKNLYSSDQRPHTTSFDKSHTNKCNAQLLDDGFKWAPMTDSNYDDYDEKPAPRRGSGGSGGCNKDQIMNPATGRCVSRKGKIGQELLSSSKKPLKQKSSSKVKSKCKKDQILNPDTGRCVSRKGKIGQGLVHGGAPPPDQFVALKPPSIAQSLVNMIFRSQGIRNGDMKGMLCWHSTGSGKCHAIDTPIMMHDGSVKLVQNVVCGDRIMGDDSSPRTVLELGRGTDAMYTIEQENGADYTVNSEHILTLINDDTDSIIDIEVCNFIKLPEAEQRKWRGFKVRVDFPHKEICREPYDIGFETTQGALPREYLINSFEIRQALLSGLVSAFGKRMDDGLIRLFITCPVTREDAVFLCRSLGHETSTIDTDVIVISEVANALTRTRISVVKSADQGDYYGFTIDGNHRYLMGDCTVTHNTCTAAGIMDAMWDTNKQIIYLTSIEGLASNPPFKFQECMSQMYERFHGKSPEHIHNAFQRRGIKFLSFTRMANRLKKSEGLFKTLGIRPGDADPRAEYFPNPTDYISSVYGKNPLTISNALAKNGIRSSDQFVDMDNSILIIDEVHNLFKPSLAQQEKDHKYLKEHLIDDVKHRGKHPTTKHPTTQIAILTATPGDTVEKTIALLNIVRDPKTPPIVPINFAAASESQLRAFKESIAGTVSHFDMNGDPGRVPKLVDPGIVKFPMSDVQFDRYREEYYNSQKTEGTMAVDEIMKKIADPNVVNKPNFPDHNHLNKYYMLARKYSNMLFEFEKGMRAEEFSSKLPALLKKIAEFPKDKHYVYSAFYVNRGSSHGILQMAKELTSNYGYKQYKANDKNPSPAKRFVILSTTQLKSDKETEKIMKVFNSDANKNGELIHVMLASQKFNEGIDLKAVRHIHIFEPLVTMASDTQTLGRARRNCSHSQLPYDDWSVTIHRYMSDFPVSYKGEESKDKLESDLQNAVDGGDKKLAAKLRKELKSLGREPVRNIEEVIQGLAKNHLQDITILHHAMQEAAVDCHLLQSYHDNSGVKCAFVPGA